METYIDVFKSFVLVIDFMLLIVMCFCIYVNASALLKDAPHTYDRAFRTVLLMQVMSFLHANYEATQRHIEKFMLDPNFTMDASTVQSLLSDRGGMLFTGVCALILTLKWSPLWFKKLIG